MYVKVYATTGSKKDECTAVSDVRFDVSVRAKPVQNLANKSIIALIAKHFSVPEGKVRIVNGHHSPSKLLSVDM